jgi:autotransporter-associated beta strand protein
LIVASIHDFDEVPLVFRTHRTVVRVFGSGSCVSAMRPIAAALVLMWAVAALGVNAALADAPSGYHLAFAEEFNGTYTQDADGTYTTALNNQTKFGYASGWDYPNGNVSNAAVRLNNDGCATLKTYSVYGAGGSISGSYGGFLGTLNNQFTYGYYETRMQVHQTAPQTWAAFWLWSATMAQDGRPAAEGNEVDIMENKYTSLRTIAENIGWGGYDNPGAHAVNYYPTVTTFQDTWHTYGLLWTPTAYTFYVDGVAKNTCTRSDAISKSPEIVYLDGLPGADGAPAGGFGTVATSVTQAAFDYVRIYQVSPQCWNLGSGGNGTWNASDTNWSFLDSGGTAAWTNNQLSDAYFQGTGGTVTIAGGFTPAVNSLTFQGGNFTITGSSLTLASSGITVAAGLTATIASPINGTLGLLAMGQGTLVLSGNNTYTGRTAVNGGGSTLNIQSPNALGSTADGTIVNNYATLQIQGGITTAAEPLSLVGPGVNWSGALRSVSGNNNYTGPITLTGDVRMWVDGGSTLTLSGGITANGINLEVVPVGSLVINSPIAIGTGGLTMNGSLLTLSAANTYSGPTTINAGTVKVNNTTGSGTGSGMVTVNSGATLGGSGIIGGPVVVAGGRLAPGNSPGILTVNNRVTLQTGSTFSAEVFGLAAGTGYDQLTTTGPVSLAGTLALTFGSFTPTSHDILILINNTGTGATTGIFQYADNAKIGRFDGCDWYITYDASNGVTPSLNGGNDVAIYSVPEPATLTLVAVSLAALLAYGWRK